MIQEAERYGAPEGSTRQSKKPKPFPSYVALMCDLVYKVLNYCAIDLQAMSAIELLYYYAV